MMDASELLGRAGWEPGRRVDVAQAQADLAAEGIAVVPPAVAFLAEFNGLSVHSEDGRKVVRISGEEAGRHADPEWCEAYAEAIGRRVTPIGEYSHMVLLIDDEGAFWGAFDADYGYMGDTLLDVVQGLLVDPGLRRLDRVVPD